MRIRILAVNMTLTATLLAHIEHGLRFALIRSQARIRRVVIRVGETNVSRRGHDKYCRVQVYLEHAAPVLIEDTGADLHAVVARVAERAGRRVAICLDRRHENGAHAALTWACPG